MKIKKEKKKKTVEKKIFLFGQLFVRHLAGSCEADKLFQIVFGKKRIGNVRSESQET